MGCTDEQGKLCDPDEKPSHTVKVSDFYISKHEVTQAQWKKIMDKNPSYFKGDDLPVEQVTWNDVQTFIRKLNAQTGSKYRLPTEAEWEYAARGGNKTKRYRCSGGDNADDVAWCATTSQNKTHPVGTKQPNELGIYDMSGNVWEWCADGYKTYEATPLFATNAPVSTSKDVMEGTTRVFRGGSWNTPGRGVRVSYRSYKAPSNKYYYLGFRLACCSGE
ncbi:hypothetical protein FACS1894201_07360 [Bacteroidia bacterium]|nr:hypothetical protein FACS1894201_07360 [Bacteroidia bacterium]